MSANAKEMEMENTQELYEENRSLAWTVLIYYAVILVAFVIGLYGLFSLIWLAGDSLAQNVQVPGSLL
ncbi:MAG: hypothetical protein V7641_2026 [Blastocatellia bacterium]